MNIKWLVPGYLNLLMVIVSVLPVLSCNTDDNEGGEPGDSADKVANEWVYGFMQTDYLWLEDIPSSVNTGLRYDEFFRSLLSVNDGRPDEDRKYGFYSYIEKIDKTLTTRADDHLTVSYGFDYIITQTYLYDPRVSTENAYGKIYATVVSVTKGSPAETAGLKRGDHIFKIGGRELTTANYLDLLPSLHASTETSSVTFTLCELTETQFNRVKETIDGNTVYVPIVTREEASSATTLKAASISETPVYTANILTESTKKVGYLVYNEFERGGDQGVFDSQLIDVFGDFSGSGIDELILDLRYNPGGYVSSCQLLASLIVPASMTGNTFQTSVFRNASPTTWRYTSQANTVGLNKIYIIGTSHSASASEALLHCLRASGIEVIHIGNRTEGKNVGMTLHSSDELQGNQALAIQGYEYRVWPVTFTIQDVNGETYSRDGIDPKEKGGYVIYEDYGIDFPELGDRSEPLLAAALYHINNGSFPASTRAITGGQEIEVAGNIKTLRSPKPFKGMRID
ncbi:MAG: PDZ domain-containing protein [Rikenellaceae bacterium]|nr:PDZ domain-containing protein [Rikenellaceae bacterium]